MKDNATKVKPRIYAAHWSATPLVRILRPMQEFIHQAQSGGIVLLIMTIIALAIANSPLSEGYMALLDTHIGINVGPFVLDESVLHWINDGLMAVFFFLVGLEIKREILVGELASPRAAALPIVAAIGGVAVPALIYILFNAGGSGARGWGVPMATDIAFALGVLALLGSRVPFGLKVFLTAVAIVDDLIAVLVIAIFYSGGLNYNALGLGFGILLLLMLVNLFGFRNPIIYAALGVIVWLAFLNSGVHATIAGVLIALTIPARSRIDAPTFMVRVREILDRLEGSERKEPSKETAQFQESAVLTLEDLCEQVQAPLQKMEHGLHSWSAFMIMPIFAFANAGVAISADSLAGASMPVMLGIVLGLVIGKPVGIVGASWLVTRAGIADLPQGVTWHHMMGAGILAGIGFTMSLFIASLAFIDPETLATAKLAILIASLIAGVMGVTLLSRAPRVQPEPIRIVKPSTSH